MGRLSVLISALMLAISTDSAKSHEFWLSPADYTVEAGAEMAVTLRVGQSMKGAPIAFLPHDITRSEVVEGDTVRPVTGRMGDSPAIVMPAGADGLAVVVHETGDSRVTYQDFAVFTRFIEHKDLKGALDAHAARGLPATGFQETYRRYAKSLIAVGSGVGSDRVMGLKIEIVALANPYTDDLSAGLPVLVLLDGAPRVDVQVEVFATAADASVTINRYRTDAAGRVVVPVQADTEYLIDSVSLVALPNDVVTTGPVWHSDWASLTFRVPGE